MTEPPDLWMPQKWEAASDEWVDLADDLSAYGAATATANAAHAVGDRVRVIPIERWAGA